MKGQANSYLEIARCDYEAACKLFNAKLFSQALYSFQQAVEKMCKYVAINYLSMPEQEIKRKIGHNMIEVFKRMYKQIAEDTPFPIDIPNENDFKELEDIIKNGTESLFIQYTWENIISVARSPWPIDESKYDSEFDALVDYWNDMGFDVWQGDPPTELIKQCVAVEMRKKTSQHLVNINLGTKLLPLLLFMTIYMSRYKTDEFRYPSEELGNPANYFNERQEYVTKLSQLFPLYEGLLDFIIHIKWQRTKE
jgi:HEPN domain-containing protein